MPTVTPTPPPAAPPAAPPAGETVVVDANGVVLVPDTPPDAPPADAPKRPEGLPEKFADTAALIVAYAELEAKQSGTPPTPAAPPTTPPAAPPATPPATPPAADVVKDLNLNPAELGQELLANNGAFSNETYAKFEGAGISKDVVDAYISGQQALANEQTARVHAMVGGEEQFKAMQEWAKTGLTPEEVVAFDATMASGDQAAISLAVSGMKATYQAQYGIDPSLLTGAAPRTSGAEPFLSLEDMYTAMADPKYKISSEYRGKIAARIDVSKLWG